MPQETVEISSEVTQESGEIFDFQETILDYELYANVYDNQKPEIDAVEKRMDLSASFHGELDILDSINLSESRKSNVFSSDSNFFSSPVNYDSHSQLRRLMCLKTLQSWTIMVERRLI